MAQVWNAMLGQWMEDDGNPSTTKQPAGSNIGPGATNYGPQPVPQSSAPVTYANRTEEINAKNPNADPSMPYVQGGTTGGYLAGTGVTIGEGRSITPEQAERQKQEALASGLSQADIDAFLAKNPGDTNRLMEAFQSGGDNPTGGSSVSQTWNSTGSSNVGGRANDFYAQLLARSQQGLDVDRNNPVIRQQADAYSANAQRARREYLNDQAEAIGPVGNIAGEERLSAERVGQATGAFEAELMGRELQAKRDEIAQALTLMSGRLTTEQTLELQRELGLLDAEIRREGLGVQREGMGLQNDQFLRELALRNWIAQDSSQLNWANYL